MTASFAGEADARTRDIEALQCVLAGLLALASVALLFVLRAADDNRLVSWQWTFASSDLPLLLAAVAAMAAVAYRFSRADWEGHRAKWLIGATGLLVCLPFWRAPEIIVDASRYFVQAKHLAASGVAFFMTEWGRAIPAWTDLPLVPFVYGSLFSLLGEHRIFVQLLNSLLFAATLVLTGAIGGALWDRRTGLLAAVLLLGMPYLLTQVPLLLVDVPAMFLVTLACYATIVALQRGGAVLLAGATVALSLALLSKYSAWVALAFPLCFALGGGSAGRRERLRRAGGILLGTAFFGGACWLWKGEVIAAQFALLLGYQIPALGGWQESAISTFFFQIHPFVTLGALVSAGVALGARDPRYLAPAAIVLLVLVVGALRIRYLIIVMPLIALLAAYGLRALREVRLRQFVAGCAAGTAIVVGLAGYLPFLRGTSAVNIAQAGAVLDGLDGDAAEVIVVSAERSAVNPAIVLPLLDLATHKRLVFRRDLSRIGAPPREVRETSPLRFTWELPDAPFLLGAAPPRTPVVLLTDAVNPAVVGAAAARLRNHVEVARLLRDDGVFRFQTLVRIYLPE